MAFRNFDVTGNENQSTVLSKIRAMLRELYEGASLAALTVAGQVTAGSFALGTGTKTATATAGAATLNKSSGVVTTESLTTAQDALYTLTLTNSEVAAASVVVASLANGTNTQGSPMIEKITPAAGSVVITVRNRHASAEALNGTLKIAFAVIQ